MRRTWWLSLPVLSLLAACDMPPPTRPRPDYPPPSYPALSQSRPTPSDEEIARKASELQTRARTHYEDQKQRVERVGKRLLETIPGHPNVQFVIVQGDPSINAGATFGQVAITSGMLNFIHDDDEMAVVLGHELAHIQQGHVMKGTMGNLALNVLAIVLETQAPGAGQAAGGIGQLFLNHYSQNQEREADDVGLRYAYEAGFDPRAAVDVQERLAVEVPQSMSAGYFDTHPSSVERAVSARLEAEQLLKQGDPPGRDEVLARERADQPVRSSRSARRGSARSSGGDPDYEDADAPAPRRRGRTVEDDAPRASSGESGGVSDDCRRAAVYAEMAQDARAADERDELYRRARRYCPSLAESSASEGTRHRSDHEAASDY